jgi:acetyltransferase-like isoleucine patch superfamily enzyme
LPVLTIRDAGERNQIVLPREFNQPIQITVSGHDNVIEIGADTRFGRGIIEIRGHRSAIRIGAKCFLNGEFRCRASDAEIVVGEQSTAMNVQLSAHEPGRIRLGRDCMLSGDIRMDTSDMHSVVDIRSGKRINPPGDVTLGDHVWLGFGVYVTPGVTIGSGSIVGARSVVTKDVQENCLAVGVPARVIRTGVTWDRNRLPL